MRRRWRRPRQKDWRRTAHLSSFLVSASIIVLIMSSCHPNTQQPHTSVTQPYCMITSGIGRAACACERLLSHWRGGYWGRPFFAPWKRSWGQAVASACAASASAQAQRLYVSHHACRPSLSFYMTHDSITVSHHCLSTSGTHAVYFRPIACPSLVYHLSITCLRAT